MASRTRSSYRGELKMLPPAHPTVWVHAHDFFSYVNDDPFEILMNEKHADDEDMMRKKWEALRPCIEKKRRAEMHLFSAICDKPARQPAFLGHEKGSDSIDKMSVLLDRGSDWVQRIRFQDRRHRVAGFCDAVVSRAFLEECLGPMDPSDSDVSGSESFYICMLKPVSPRGDRPNQGDLLQLEAAALLRFFAPREPRISQQAVVVLRYDKDMTLKTPYFWEVRSDLPELDECLRRIRKIKRWSPLIDLDDLPPSLFPNLKVGKRVDPPWVEETRSVAHRVGDITMLWSCTARHRKLSHHKGVFSWRDERFTPSLVGITDPEKSEILDRVLRVNRGSEEWRVLVSPRVREEFPELYDTSVDHLFVDFEYIGDDVYMIGVWEPRKGEYHCFWAESLGCPPSDSQAWAGLQGFLAQRRDAVVWYWYAERGVIDKIGAPIDTGRWKDLWRAARGVGMKGVFDFSLKSFVRSMSRFNRIPFSYDDLECQNGDASMDLAARFYETGDPMIKQSLEEYNQKDCEAMWHVLLEIRRGSVDGP